jgi:hypothetical protein
MSESERQPVTQIGTFNMTGRAGNYIGLVGYVVWCPGL